MSNLHSLAEQLNQARKKHGRRRLWLSALSIVVIIATVTSLTLPAFTQEKIAYCGIEEHVHGPECRSRELICGLEEGEGHTHDTACYEEVLICGLEEHRHSLACYSDPDAVEEERYWNGMFPTLEGSEAENAVSIALSQLGYHESAENYCVLEDGTVKGYTRYGHLWGDPYGDWDAMFVAFCLHYAHIDEQVFPYGRESAVWMDLLKEKGLYIAAGTDGTAPQPGDVVFFGKDPDGAAEHVGIVQSVGEDGFRTVEGDVNNGVALCGYMPEDAAVLGFGVLPEELRLKDGNASKPLQEDETMSFPAQSFRAELNGMTVEVEADEGAFPENTSMEVQSVPADQVIDAVNSAVEDQVVWVQAVDICFYDADHTEIQPLLPIRVLISSDMISDDDTKCTGVVHVDDQGTGRLVAQTAEESGDNEIVFETNSFSVYVLVGTTFEKTVLADNGNNYKITVSFGLEAMIPKDADLWVQEILPSAELADGETDEYGEYAEKVRALFGWEYGSPQYFRLFDIKIVDADGSKVNIAAPVDVRIELADKTRKADGADDTQVVHFDSVVSAGDVIENTTIRGSAVSFEAEGFSAYAIVEGPEAIPLGWHTVSSLEELAERGSQGVYIGNPKGYYFMNTLTGDSSRMGITKTKPAQAFPASAAALYYFEPGGSNDRFYVYCYANDGTTRQYVKNANNNSLSFADQADATAFTASITGDGSFTLNNGEWYWNMQGGENGSRFCSYNKAGDQNNPLNFWYYTTVGEDPYVLDNKSYGLMNWNGSASGKALMSDSSNENTLDAKVLTVLAKRTNNEDKLFVPNDSDISIWTFRWVSEDKYQLIVNASGSTKYLRISGQGLSLVSEPDDACTIQVVPGTGSHAGEICLKAGNATLTYTGSADTGFSVSGSVGSEWLHLVEISELTADYFMTFSADKVSISDPEVTTGTSVIVYTRIWNEEKLRYDFYAIDHEGSLYPCYENGDSIEWVGNRINTLLWQFTEYTYDDGTPNYYYELYNTYSEKYLAPQLTEGQILSDDTIGINLDGRRNGMYYSSILAWDDVNYAYAGLTTEDGRIVSCANTEAMDFYFATVQPIPVDDKLTTVPTIDHTQYGITMKLVDFSGKTIKPNGADTTQQQHDVMGNSSYIQWEPVQGLLSNHLDENGYPTATLTGRPLSDLFGSSQDVNYLFLTSTHQASGYFEFDSTRNYAVLQDPASGGGSFVVYKELGTHDASNKNTLKHGQFFPYNDLTAGSFASVNRYNLYTATADPIPDSDPRKYEQLYLIDHPNYYFGMELEASFLQTPNGLDDWGHDIIYEFTGDDDFWLYVDGELVIDLGGIHGALPGTVNYRTGIVQINGEEKTLRQVFEENYRARNESATDAQVSEYLSEYFEDGSTIFKPNSTHTMRIFFMERGAGASNLHMRFNLASIKPGTVLLSKELAGVDTSETLLAEFAYQIFYKTSDDPDAPEYPLENRSVGSGGATDYVVYRKSTMPVNYMETGFRVDGIPYEHVFLLKPGETAEISFPEGATSYRIAECGVNTGIYNQVSVNNNEIVGEPVEGHADRSDFGIGYASAKDRGSVVFTNTVDPDALRTLTISKRLFQEDGETPISPDEDGTAFSFRMYFKTELAEDYIPANMYTYHVKDPDGYYCRWDAGEQRFISVGSLDYTSLSEEERAAVSFTTSMNGSISKIPADYTVELRQVLAGTGYKVEERDYEIPDGYSLQKYERFDDADDETGEVSHVSAEGVTIVRKDPHVDVCNLKGWGMRVNKVWSDADYMDARDPVYFGLFTGDENARILVPGTLRELPYGDSSQSLYWYFDHLPVAGTSGVNDYAILEVIIVNPTVDDAGYVTAYESMTPAVETITLQGRQTGESGTSSFEYTVIYSEGEQIEGSNVRVDTVTNNRPGVVLKKQDWNGHTLAGATFTLSDAEGEQIGSFTSDADGLITVAFLRDNVEYTLNEDRSPQGYYGLQAPMTISLSGGTVSVGDETDQAYYSLTQGAGITPTLVIRDRPYVLEVVKEDRDSGDPLQGVEFALHRQVTVDGVTIFDYNPMPGYASLITDENGIIPQADNTLPPGTYELREKNVLPGYMPLTDYVDFTISNTGAVTLGNVPDDVALETDMTGEDGAVRYTLTICNAPITVRFQKVDINAPERSALEGAVFDLYRGTGSDKELLYTGLTSRSGDGLLVLNDQTDFALAAGDYTLIETAAPPGYSLKTDPVTVTVGTADVTYDEGTNLSSGGVGKLYDSEARVFTLKISNAAGYELPASGGIGVVPFYLAGAALILTTLLLCRSRPKRKRGD